MRTDEPSHWVILEGLTVGQDVVSNPTEGWMAEAIREALEAGPDPILEAKGKKPVEDERLKHALAQLEPEDSSTSVRSGRRRSTG
jgi:hypothetical protein